MGQSGAGTGASTLGRWVSCCERARLEGVVGGGRGIANSCRVVYVAIDDGSQGELTDGKLLFAKGDFWDSI